MGGGRREEYEINKIETLAAAENKRTSQRAEERDKGQQNRTEAAWLCKSAARLQSMVRDG